MERQMFRQSTRQFNQNEKGVAMFFRTALSFFSAVVVCALPVVAQEVSAGITGKVTDPTGGAIVGAAVTAKERDRGTEWPTKTNEDGIYAFPRVPLGESELRVDAAGFKTSTQPNIQLEVNQRARIDVTMQVGAITESVSVSADAAILQTETAQVGSVITPQTIVHTPLISRNAIALTLLAPGVTTPDPNSFNSGIRTAGGGRPYVNGNRKEANNFLLDGVDNNQVSDNLTSYQPNVDAIQEFKLITNNASAEFGNYQGGIINVVIKSGTNGLHGNLFEFFRNDQLNANNWGDNARLNVRAPQRWNQYGGTLGGRIIKDKLFFFTDFQGLRRANPGSPSSITVIPAEFRRGDFSRLLTEQNTVVYNPFQTDAQGNRAPFPNNQIPLSLFNPVARALFANNALYPLPVNSNLRFNQFNSRSSYVNSDQGDFKLDWKISNKDDFSGRYSNGRQDQPSVATFPLIYDSFNIAPFQNGVINWTRTINPTLVNEARFGVNNILLNNGDADKGLGDIGQQLGIRNAGAGLLSLQFNSGFATGIGSANIGTQQLFANTTYHYADNVTIIRGRHLMKTGLNILRQQINTFYAGNNGRTGFISFNGQFTQGPNPLAPTSRGFAEPDFVLGLPNDLGRALSTGTYRRLPLNPPFNSEFETRYDPGNFSTPGSTLDQGLSGLNPKDPYVGANIRLWDPNVRPAEVQQWNLTLEYQLPANNVLTVGYEGQPGTDLGVPLALAQHRLVNGKVLPSPYLAGNPDLVSKITQISGTESNGNQKYNSLQAGLRRRFQSGLEYSVAYTWSNALSDAIGYYADGGQSGSQSAYFQNIYDLPAELGPPYFDVRHSFVTCVFYNLPWGKGKPLGSGWNPAVNTVFGGWQLGGILTLHTRFPLTVTAHDPSGTLPRR